MNINSFLTKLFTLSALCTLSFFLGYKTNISYKDTEYNAIIDHLNNEISDNESRILALFLESEKDKAIIQNAIIARFQSACEDPNSFIIEDKIYICMPAEAPKKNTQKHTPKKEEYSL